MNLRIRSAIVLAIALGANLVVLAAILATSSMRAFEHIERLEVNQQVGRAVDAMRAEARAMSTKVHDYAAWDESYAFVAGDNPTYPQEHIPPSAMLRLDVDLVAIIRPRGDLHHATWIKPDSEESSPTPPSVIRAITKLVDNPADIVAVSGLIATADGPLLFAAAPVTNSDGDRPPNGLFIMGRLLDGPTIARLGRTVHLDLALLAPTPDRPGVIINANPGANGWWEEPELVRNVVVGDNAIRGGVTVIDHFGHPAADLKVLLRRPLIAVARSVQESAIRAMLLTGVVTFVIAGMLFRRSIIGRVERLSAEVRAITSGGAEADRARITIQGRDEISSLARDIVDMLESLRRARALAEQAAQAKAAFLANTSHEIRTPLNGVLGSLQLLERTALNEQQARYVHMARTAGSSLLELISDVLDVSKIESEAIALEELEIPLREICEQVADILSPRAFEKQLTLRCDLAPDLPLVVRGDPTRLRQVMLNLFSNAVKFTNRGGVVLRVTREHDDADKVTLRFAVTDTGPGVPEDKRHLLFRPFSQIDPSTTRVHGGTGLGLLICKSLAELMGGEIGVESEVGRGSTFWFTIRVPIVQDTDTPRERKPRGFDVLVVAPDAAMRATLDAEIRSWGFYPIHASTPSHALARARDGLRPLALVISPGPRQDSLLVVEEAKLIDAMPADSAVVWLAPGEDEPLPHSRRTPTIVPASPLDRSALYDAVMAGLLQMHPRQIEASASTDPKKLDQANPAPSGAKDDSAGPTGRDVAPDLTDVHVLLVEDNPINQAVATQLLEAEGARVDVAENGLLACARAREVQYDAILMDCQMPEMDGFTAAAAIRTEEARDGSGRRVPIIALTANALSDDRDRCLAAGMDDFLTKPLDIDAVALAIDTHRRRRLAQIAAHASNSASPHASGRPPHQRPPQPPNADPNDPAQGASTMMDWQGFGTRCRNNSKLMLTILGMFEDSLKSHGEKLDPAVASNVFEIIRVEAHALKGSAANVGATNVYDAASRLEDRAKAADAPGCADARAALAHAVAQFLAAMPAHRAHLQGPSAKDAA